MYSEFTRTNLRKFSFSVRTVDRWRKRLPDKIKQANTRRTSGIYLKTKIFEFWRNREKKNESFQGTPVKFLRYRTTNNNRWS
jgi:hypothetical protein